MRIIKETLRECEYCGETYLGKGRSKYCSKYHRTQACRIRVYGTLSNFYKTYQAPYISSYAKNRPEARRAWAEATSKHAGFKDNKERSRYYSKLYYYKKRNYET